MNIKVLQNITMEGSTFTYNGIICAVNIHRQALKLFKRFQSAIKIMVICLMVCGVIALSLNLYQIASFTNNVKELLLSSCYVFLIILYMFLSNYMGQNILEHNKHVFVTVYNVQWYKAPLRIQKMILFLLQRGAKEYTLNIGGLIDGSMECFATLLKTSVSYFTVIYSTQ
ncbi:odorant receptor Or2-like [Pogonomyrmex barbatus]|uniref:Odorant receptor Or2-like n=1 Tax=Pogonomyrmex barbatus TaxID=144034 RepID=A0A8N1S6E1_9HYME|nr:odorant receptor Or2-like [Pogonomyrmex barbatus]